MMLQTSNNILTSKVVGIRNVFENSPYKKNEYHNKVLINSSINFRGLSYIKILNSLNEESYHLSHAVNRGDVQRVYYLLNSKGVDPNIKSSSGTPTLLHALLTSFKNFGVIKLLLKFDADVNVTTADGLTPLMIAVIKGYVEMVECLLEADANRNVRDIFGYTALDFAEKLGYDKIVNLLNINKEKHINCFR